MCTSISELTGVQIPIINENRDLTNTKGAGAQLASSKDRSTGEQLLINDERHDARGNKGTGVQRITDYEGRDLGKNKGTGVQLASGSIYTVK